jgi:hypothetical protein
VHDQLQPVREGVIRAHIMTEEHIQIRALRPAAFEAAALVVEFITDPTHKPSLPCGQIQRAECLAKVLPTPEDLEVELDFSQLAFVL